MPTKQSILFTRTLSAEQRVLCEQLHVPHTDIPFINIQPRPSSSWISSIADTAEAWVFTSSNAVNAVVLEKNDLIIPDLLFAVGPKVRSLLTLLEKPVHMPTEYNAKALADLIASHRISEVIHFCGNIKPTSVSDHLPHDTTVHEIEVYDTSLTPQQVDQDIFTKIVFMSPSAVRSFSQHNPFLPHVTYYSIGPSTTHELNDLGAGKIKEATEATFASLVRTLNT
ncbi:MAG: uroporphyrinogen-III synthase [Bacteroidota bacterium]